MEHREPPPIVAEDPRNRSVAPAAADRLALPHHGLPRPGRLGNDRPRATDRFAILLGVLLGSTVAFLAARAARTWLGEQPVYQLPFDAIELDPPPPSWYRGGVPGFLEDVRRRARMPMTIPLLDLKETELKQAFQHSPWTEDVVRIVYRPRGILVRPVYRRPVALIETSGGNAYLVDASAVVLPREDLDMEIGRFVEEQGLIRINGVGLADPQDPKPGITWHPRPGAADAAPGNERISAAAKLAGFLLERMRSIDRAREPALGIRYINPMDPHGRGLFLKNDESTSILWREAPGEELPGSLTAEEKWEMLGEWSRQGKNVPIPPDDYWEITPDGVKHKIAPETTRLLRPQRDHATIPANAAGHSEKSLSHWE